MQFFSTLSEIIYETFDKLLNAYCQKNNKPGKFGSAVESRQATTWIRHSLFCDFCTLTYRAHRDQPNLVGKIVVNIFIEGLNIWNLHWEVRKLKHETTELFPTRALELRAYLGLEGPNHIVNAIDNPGGWTTLKIPSWQKKLLFLRNSCNRSTETPIISIFTPNCFLTEDPR